MGGLKEIRTRIDSVNSTMQITSAMKLVAASKLRKAQNSIIAMRPYASKLQEILQNLSASVENSDEGTYSQQRVPEKVLIVAISSNRGLCGAFNTNIIKTTKRHIQENYNQQMDKGQISVFTIGKKVTEFFSKNGYKLVGSDDDITEHVSFEAACDIAETLMKAFVSGSYDRIDIVYNRFKNAATQLVTTEQFLPVLPPEDEEHQAGMDYIFEPGKQEIVTELIPKSLKIQLFKTILDSIASEHGARMTAMHQATDNATELLRDLKLHYNKARQASITNEILEIVGGAEALKG